MPRRQWRVVAETRDTAAACVSCMGPPHADPHRASRHATKPPDRTIAPGASADRRRRRCRAIYAVRTGSVKTRLFDRDGNEQVLGFYLPGEVVGLNAIYPEHFPCDAVALEDTQFCRFSFPAMSALAARQPAVQQHLFRLISKELGAVSLLAGDHSADERMAAFLVDLSNRYAARGFSATRFHLSMSRGDIANY